MRFEVYQDRAGEWRWRLRAGNGQIVADSGEGYATSSNARMAIRRVLRGASIDEVTHVLEGGEFTLDVVGELVSAEAVNPYIGVPLREEADASRPPDVSDTLWYVLWWLVDEYGAQGVADTFDAMHRHRYGITADEMVLAVEAAEPVVVELEVDVQPVLDALPLDDQPPRPAKKAAASRKTTRR